MLPEANGRRARQEPIAVLRTGEYVVDIDELRVTANKVLGVADRTDALARRRTMGGASGFGTFLAGAAHTWGDRFQYLLRGLADEVEHAGYQLRGTADAYYEVDLDVQARLRGEPLWQVP